MSNKELEYWEWIPKYVENREGMGKWMIIKSNRSYFNRYLKQLMNLCEVVKISKENHPKYKGAFCVAMYIKVDDKQGHINLLQFLMNNELYPKLKDGSYKNLSFEREKDKEMNNITKDYKSYYTFKDFFNSDGTLKDK
ncbi:hypothetical protein [Mycoplasma phocoeninasale]|uniref:hypothetical protein n=1 Tax=Mycoplasma phocoeninasale TaxID=2726117 RepID=UPI001966EB12|nr:hypothetical protein [Mycoplasma phocoeninasale]MBN0970976.1 hypothetical protein [Mycoplasma phocoeninasale]